jgi:hypothetical protein
MSAGMKNGFLIGQKIPANFSGQVDAQNANKSNRCAPAKSHLFLPENLL